jgi:hypothetical protein
MEKTNIDWKSLIVLYTFSLVLISACMTIDYCYL